MYFCILEICSQLLSLYVIIMKIILFVFLLLLSYHPLKAQRVQSNDIIGTYQNENNNYKVHIYHTPQTNEYEGKIVWVNDAVANTNIHVNMVVLKELVFSNEQWKGQAFVTKINQFHPATFTFVTPTSLKVTASFNFFTATRMWKKLP